MRRGLRNETMVCISEWELYEIVVKAYRFRSTTVGLEWICSAL
jgi:hypothetical protein